MSNRRDLRKVRGEALPMRITMAEAALKVQGKELSGAQARAVRRSMRTKDPAAAYLTDHSVPHEREATCGPKCIPLWI